MNQWDGEVQKMEFNICFLQRILEISRILKWFEQFVMKFYGIIFKVFENLV